MKIVVVCRSTLAHPFSGGMEQLTHDLLTEWLDMGYDVECITTTGGSHPQARYPVSEVPGREGRYSRRWRRQLPKEVLRAGPDVILSVSGAAHGGLVRSSKVPILMQAHGTSVDEIKSKLRRRQLSAWLKVSKNLFGLLGDIRNYKRYTGAIAVSQSVALSIRSIPRPFRPPFVTVIENGVAVTAGPKTLAAKNRSLRVGYAGRLHFEKGVDRLLLAARSTSWEVEVIGDGPDRRRLEQMDASPARFHGRMPHSEVLALVGALDVLVVPSRRIEGLPLVVLEALSVGTPCVVTGSVAASFHGALPPGVVVLVDGDDDAELRSAVSTAALMEAELPELFTLRRTAARYGEVFERLVDHG